MSHEILDKLTPVPVRDDQHICSNDDAGYEKRLKAHNVAVRELALEGLKLDPEAEEWSMQVVRGEISEDEYTAKVLARTE